MAFVDDLRRNFYILSQNFPSTGPVLEQALFALVAREHVLWYSLPGRAKSQLSGSIFGMFTGAPTFSIQCTKDTPPESIFGNIIPKMLMENGHEVYNLEGGLVTSTFAFLDEFMDLADMVMRSTNSVLNERLFFAKDMGGEIKSPLHTAIATSNYLRQREATQAVIDRFMCKAYLRGIDGVADSMRAGNTYLDYSGKRLALPHLPYEGLAELADRAGKSEKDGGVKISDGMRLLHVLLVTEFQRRRTKAAQDAWQKEQAAPGTQQLITDGMPTPVELGVPDISPRTLVKLHDFTRASAVLEGRNAVTQTDMRAIQYGLITIGDESGDDVIWASVCRDMLGMNERQVRNLEQLGALAAQVGQLQAERSETTGIQLRVSGQLYAASTLSTQQLKQMLGGKHMTLNMAVDAIGDDIMKLTLPHTGFDLLKGWS